MFVMPGSRVGRQRGRPSARGVGAWVFLREIEADNVATVDFTDVITGEYDEYVFELIQILPAAASGVTFHLRVSTDNGATFISSASYADAGFGWNRFGSASYGTDGGTSIRLHNSTLGNTVIDGYCGAFRLQNPAARKSKYPSVFGDSGNQLAVGGTMENGKFSGVYLSATAVNAIRFYFSSDNILSGLFRLYGIAK